MSGVGVRPVLRKNGFTLALLGEEVALTWKSLCIMMGAFFFLIFLIFFTDLGLDGWMDGWI